MSRDAAAINAELDRTHVPGVAQTLTLEDAKIVLGPREVYRMQGRVYLTVPEACELTGWDKKTLYARVPHLTLGKRTHRFRLDNLDVYLDVGQEHLDALQKSEAVGSMGRVYFIEAAGADRIKIGFTSRAKLQQRVSEWRTGCPFELKTLGLMRGSHETEALVHARFESVRVPGTEWFHASKELRSYVRFVCASRRPER